MGKDSREDWKHFLDPEILRPNLIMAAIYIIAFETLKNSIIDRIHDFFVTGFCENGEIVLPEYQEEVLSRNKSPLYASLGWLIEMDAIDDEDITKFDEIKKFRNLLAHEINKLLMNGLPNDFLDRFNDIIVLLNKVETWWIVNYEIPINPDFSDQRDGINESEILPGPIVSLKILIDVALGPNEIALKYIEDFKKNFGIT